MTVFNISCKLGEMSTLVMASIVQNDHCNNIIEHFKALGRMFDISENNLRK